MPKYADRGIWRTRRCRLCVESIPNDQQTDQADRYPDATTHLSIPHTVGTVVPRRVTLTLPRLVGAQFVERPASTVDGSKQSSPWTDNLVNGIDDVVLDLDVQHRGDDPVRDTSGPAVSRSGGQPCPSFERSFAADDRSDFASDRSSAAARRTLITVS